MMEMIELKDREIAELSKDLKNAYIRIEKLEDAFKEDTNIDIRVVKKDVHVDFSKEELDNIQWAITELFAGLKQKEQLQLFINLHTKVHNVRKELYAK